MFQKILCPIDFSPGSRLALRAAVRLASAANAELALAHVWDLPVFPSTDDGPGAPAIVRLLEEEQERALAAVVKEASELGARRVSSRLLEGAPWDQIVEAARAEPACDLIVMGSHGHTGLSRFLLGSVAEKVVRHAPCSVLVARVRGASAPFRHVLCPLDFSNGSRPAAELAARLAAPGGAGIVLLHVIELPVAVAGEALPRDFLEDLDRRSARLLEEWAAHVRAHTAAPVITRTRLGSPGAQALAVLDEDPGFDLVVVGSHGRTSLPRALLGSVAEKLVRHAPCSVLVARAGRSPGVAAT